MSDTPQRPHLADTPQDNSSSRHGKADLRDLFEAYLVASDTALLTGSPIPKLPAEIANSPFREQAESGLHLLQLLSRARETVLGPEAPRAGIAVPLERVAHFRLLRELGRGGHGVVYLAVDERLGREVALKVPRPETLLNPELRKRFLREAQAAGQLDHPHLVPVHEVGEEGHLVYIASQYIEGPDLAQWLLDRKTPVPPREAAELVADLADGVEHAHVHGVLHRDIKPSNVLLADEGGGNSPRLTDFGLAKLRELGSDQTQTRTGVLLGTPTYMAPELAAGKLREVGPATDVYGLGAVLYEVLTGRPPFRGENDVDTIHQVVHEEPLNPQRLRPGLSSELAAICLKCLDKAPERRYASAALLAADLRRYLNGQPTLARPATALDRGWKWAKRRPAVAGLSAGLLVALLTLAVGSIWYSQSLKNALAREQAVRRSLEQRDAAAQLSLVQQMLAEDRPADAHTRIAALAPSWGQEPPYDGTYLTRIARAETRRIAAHKGAVLALALAPDGQFCATAGVDQLVHLWNVSDGLSRAKLEGHTVPVKTLAFCRRDAALASGGDNGSKSELLVWDSRTGQQTAELPGPELAIRAVTVSPDGEWLAAAGSGQRDGRPVGQARVWNRTPAEAGRPSDWKLIHTWDVAGEATGVAFAADNRTLAVGIAIPGPEAVMLWDVATGQKERSLSLSVSRQITAMTASPDGRRLAVASVGDCDLDVWDLAARQKLGASQAMYYNHVLGVSAMAFHPHEYRLATACTAKPGQRNPSSVMLWDADKLCRVTEVLGTPNGDATALAYTADGRTLLVGSQDGTLRWWNIEAHTLARFFDGEGATLAVSPNGRDLVVGSNDLLYDLDLVSDEKKILRSPGSDRAHHGEFGQAAVSYDGKTIVSGGFTDGRVVLWDSDSGQHLAEWQAHDHVRSVIASPTAPLAASAGLLDHNICLWDLNQRRQVTRFEAHADRIRAMAPSPDGRFFVSVAADGSIKQWDFATGQLLQTWNEGQGLWSVAVAADNQTIAVGATDGTIRLRDVVSGETQPVSMRHAGARAQPVWLAFSPDGRLLASGSENATLILWDYRSGTPTVQWNCFSFAVDYVGFSRDARDLFFAVRQGTIGQIKLAEPSDANPASSLASSVQESQATSGALLRTAYKQSEAQQFSAALGLLHELSQAAPSAGRTFPAQYLQRVIQRELFFFRDQGTGLACFDLSEDGRQAACGSRSSKREIRFYSMAQGRLGREVFDHVQPPRALRFIPKTPWVVSGGGRDEQTELLFWDRADERLLERFAGLARGVRDLAVSADGRWVAVLEDPGGDATQAIVLLDAASRTITHRWPIPLDATTGLAELNCIRFSPDGSQLAIGGGGAVENRSQAIALFVEVASGQQLGQELKIAGPPFQSITFSRQGHRLAVGGSDGVTHLWSWPERVLLASLPGAATAQPALAFSPDGATLATGYRVAAEEGYVSQVHLWDTGSGRRLACVGRFVEGRIGLAFSPDGKSLIQAGDFRSLRKLDLARVDYHVLSAHRAAVRDIRFSAAGSELVSVGDDGLLCRFDLKGMVPLRQEPLGMERPTAVVLLPTDPPRVLASVKDKLWSQESGRDRLIERSVPGATKVTSLAAGQDGSVALGDDSGRAHLWESSTGRILKSWSVGTSPVSAIALPAEQQDRPVAAGGRTLSVLWREFDLVGDHVDTPDEVLVLAVDARAQVLAAGLRNGQILFWDVLHRRRLALADGHFGPVTAMTISSDGQTLASASTGGDVRLWNVQSGEEIMPLNAPTAEIRCLRFSPDDSLLAAGLADGTIVVWRARP